MNKWVFNLVRDFLPELLKKHLGDDEKVNEIMADVEKQRVAAFSGLLERGGILHLFYIDVYKRQSYSWNCCSSFNNRWNFFIF